MRIGVLALQGAFIEHIRMFAALNIEASPIRTPSELNRLDALAIPGGESTTICKLLYEYELMTPIRKLAYEGFPLFGTCAGMILLAKKVNGLDSEPIGALDIEVKRNAYGRQTDSFEADLSMPPLGNKAFPGIFIRAPIIKRVSDGVETLCQLHNNIVAVKQGRVVACSFHPELTDDLRFHRYFLSLVTGDILAKSSC